MGGRDIWPTSMSAKKSSLGFHLRKIGNIGHSRFFANYVRAFSFITFMYIYARVGRSTIINFKTPYIFDGGRQIYVITRIEWQLGFPFRIPTHTMATRNPIFETWTIKK